jgi:hypothetical protein
MSWYLVALLAALIIVAVRLGAKLRAANKLRTEGWDEQQIARLRAQGYLPFKEYRVDFFLALPDEMAAQSARARLEPEFSVDVKPVANDSDLTCSLHATKSMHLIVPEMQEVRRRLSALAQELHGRYDGWAA